MTESLAHRVSSVSSSVPEPEAEPLEYAGCAPDHRDGSVSASGSDTESLVSLDSVSVSSGHTTDTMGTGTTSYSMPPLVDSEELECRYPPYLRSLLLEAMFICENDVQIGNGTLNYIIRYVSKVR